MLRFIPNVILKDVTCLSAEFLEKNKIRGLILDVDNTLTEHSSQVVREHISGWIETMKANGIKLMIVSNNNYKRIKPFADKLGLSFVSMGFKPLTRGFHIAQKRFNLNRENIAVVGDQIYTDILGGNFAGMFTVLVEPISPENGLFFKFKRKLEKKPIEKYYRIANKGEQDK